MVSNERVQAHDSKTVRIENKKGWKKFFNKPFYEMTPKEAKEYDTFLRTLTDEDFPSEKRKDIQQKGEWEIIGIHQITKKDLKETDINTKILKTDQEKSMGF